MAFLRPVILSFNITLSAVHHSRMALTCLPFPPRPWTFFLPYLCRFCSVPSMPFLPCCLLLEFYNMCHRGPLGSFCCPIPNIISFLLQWWSPREFTISTVLMVCKLIKEISANVGLKRVCRGNSHTLLLTINYPKQEERCLESLIGRCFLLYHHSRRVEYFLLTRQQFSQWQTATTQPVKIHCTENFQFHPIGSLFVSTPPNFPLPSIKKVLLVLQTCLWSCHNLYVLNCSSLLFLYKLIFLLVQ